MTRPQRVQLAWALSIMLGTFLLWLIWSMRLYAFTAGNAGTTVRREFGMMRYLTVITRHGPANVPATGAVLDRTWEWKTTGVLVNAGLSAIVLVALGWSMRRMISRDRLVGRCDECGYDLTGLHSEVCPECGSRVAAMWSASD